MTGQTAVRGPLVMTAEKLANLLAGFAFEYDCGQDVYDYYDGYCDDGPDVFTMLYRANLDMLEREPYEVRTGLMQLLAFDDGSDPRYTGMLNDLIVSMDLYLAQHRP